MLTATVFCFFITALFVIPAEALTKVWKYDDDIMKKNNWEGGDFSKECEGLIFARDNEAPAFVSHLNFEKIQLPWNGRLDLLSASSIIIGKPENTPMGCVKLKPLQYHHFYDYDSWVFSSNNSAVPHLERVPCWDDDVLFGPLANIRVSLGDVEVLRVKSIYFGPIRFSSDMANELSNSVLGRDIFYFTRPRLPIEYAINICNDPWGCVCHKDTVRCPVTSRVPDPNLRCLEPVIPAGFCREICGAFVTFKPQKGFELERLKSSLKEYSSDTHASRVRDDFFNDVIQVVFSEKEYEGRSVKEAEEFVEKLGKSTELVMQEFLKAGAIYAPGSGSPVWTFFGPLFLVLLIFAAIYFVYDKDINQRVRFPMFNRSHRESFFTTPFFFRFDNVGENLIIDGQSLSGSVENLQRSFENPMYGEEPPSVSVASSVANISSKESFDGSFSAANFGSAASTTALALQHENPLYDIALQDGQGLGDMKDLLSTENEE